MSGSETPRTVTRLIVYAMVLTAAVGGGYALGTRVPEDAPPVHDLEHDPGHGAHHEEHG